MTTVQRRAAVVGANGYLGRHLASHLLAVGHRVFGYDLQDAGRSPGMSYAPLDATNSAAWDNVDTDVDAIFFFCGLGGTHRSFLECIRYLEANELSLLHLLDLLVRRGHRPRVVFPSSRLVYQGRPEPLAEDAPKEAKTVYAANKLACEAFLEAYRHAHEIPHTIFRICVPYGNFLGNAYSYGTTGAFIRMAAERGQITLFGDGSPRRTFTHVQDVCSQIAEASALPESEGQTYNVAGQPFSLREVAEAIAAKFGAAVTSVPWPENELAIESGDTVFDDARMRRLLPRPVSHDLRAWVDKSALPG